MTYYWKLADGSGFGYITTDGQPEFPPNAVAITEAEYHELERAWNENAWQEAIRAAYEAQVATYNNYLGLLQFGMPEALARSLSGWTGPSTGPVLPPELADPGNPETEPPSDAQPSDPNHPDPS